MAVYSCYIEADATATDGATPSGSGTIGDPWIGRGDDVINYALSNVLTLWGAGTGANPAWADGDLHVIYHSNKEPFIFDNAALDNVPFPSAWTGSDTTRRPMHFTVWETTTKAAGGTFIEMPNGLSVPCFEMDGTETVLHGYACNALASCISYCRVKNFNGNGVDGGFSSGWFLEGTYNTASDFDTTALDNAFAVWCHDPEINSCNGIEQAANVSYSLLEGNYNRLGRASGSGCWSNNVLWLKGNGNYCMDQDANLDRITIENNIFISDGSAGHIGINCGSTGTELQIRNNIFIGFNGAGSVPITDNGISHVIHTAGNNYFYNCNANSYTSIRDENNITLTRNPLVNMHGYDFRIVPGADLLLPKNFVAGPSGAAIFPAGGLAGVLEDRHLFTLAGINKPWARTTLPTDDV